MPIPTSVSDLDSVAANNSPAGTDVIGTTLDNYIRAHASIIKQVSDSLSASSGSSLVGYLPSGTGAVATMVQAKLRESVSIIDFGAVAGATYNTVNPSGKTNDEAFAAAFATAHQVIIPEGTWETSLNLTELQNTVIIGKGDFLSIIKFRTDINANAGLNMGSYTEISGSLQLLGVNKIGTGLNLSNASPYSFSGHIRVGKIRVSGFSIGVNFGNVYDVEIDYLNTDGNTTGIEMSPQGNGGDNGYCTTINIKNWYAINNDSYHIHANPASYPIRNLHFGNIILDSLTAGAPVAKMYLHNCNPCTICSLYAEENPTIRAISIDGGDISIDSVYLIGTLGILCSSTACNLTIKQFLGSVGTDRITAPNALNKVTIIDAVFADTSSTFGHLVAINSNVTAGMVSDGIFINSPPSATNEFLSILGTNSINVVGLRNLTAGQASPGLQFYNGDGYRHYIQEGITTAGLLIYSQDGSPVIFSDSGGTHFKVGAILGNYANDGAAAAGGIPLYGYYRNGSVVMQRVT